MNIRTIRRRIIDQTNTRKIAQQFRRAPDMERVAVREQQTGEPVYSRPVQIFANQTLISSLAPAIDKPIRAPCPQVDSRARAQIQYRDLCRELFGPLWLRDVKMSARNLCEQLHDPENKMSQKPIGIVEDHGEQRQQWRREKRQQRDGENEEGNRNNHQIREQ